MLVERHLTHTVDGVVGVVGLLRHTVLCTLHHHAAAEHAAEVGTLDAVHQTAGIDGQHTALFPIGGVGFPLMSYTVVQQNVHPAVLDRDVAVTFFLQEQRLQLVCRKSRGLGIADGFMVLRALLILTIRQTGVPEFVVGRLALGQIVILVDGDFLGNGIIVGAVVGDVQLAIAIDKGQVTIAVESAGVAGAQGDEVAVEHIMDRGGGIAEYRCGVGTRCRGSGRVVTAGKHGIVDGDARVVKEAPQIGIRILVFQLVQLLNRHKVSGGIGGAVDRHRELRLAHGLNEHLAVLGVFTFSVLQRKVAVIRPRMLVVVSFPGVIVALPLLHTFAEAAVSIFVGTVNMADIAAAEHVAIALGQTGISADFTAVDMHLCLTEYVAGTVQ